MVVVKKLLLKNKLLVFLFFFFLLLLVLVFLFHNRFIFSDSVDSYTISVNSDFIPENIGACYGNRISCKKVDVEVFSNVDTSKIGVYDLTYVASKGKKNKKLYKKVNVVDNVAPVINLSVDSLSVCPNSDSFDIDVSAYDEYDGDLSDKIKYDLQDDRLVVSVQDSSLNSDSKFINLKREDIVSPQLNLIGDETVYLPLGSSFNEYGYTVSDNCDGDITDKVTVEGDVDSSIAGTYILKYSVSDSSGNVSNKERIVNVYSPSNGSKVIYLTFDDGPSQYTGELLSILAKYDVKATFFVTGLNSSYFHYISEAYNQGHSIGLHSFSHNYSLIYSSVDAFFSDLSSINEIVKKQTGKYSNLIRFPGGSSNTVSRNYSSGIMSVLSNMVGDRGFKYFDWNVSSGDASGRVMSSDVYYQNIINGLGNGSYYVVLQHDSNINSIRSVEKVIQYGLSNGYSFKSLDFSSPVVHHRISN